MTVTRINPPEDRKEWDRKTGWGEIAFRVYNQNESRYSFESTKYLFHGKKGESAPEGATEIVVKDGVKKIWHRIFDSCHALSKVTIPKSVTTIDYSAFRKCKALRRIQLPSNLQCIGQCAFSHCKSLEAIYLPPTVTHIYSCVFQYCTSLRIINIPSNVQYFGLQVVRHCDDLVPADEERSEDQQLQWLQNRYNHLHNLCWDPSVSPQAIEQYIQEHKNNEERSRTCDKPQFTALHLLATNPSVTAQMIASYVQLMQDNIGQTPLHILCSVPHFCEDTGDAIRAYLGCSEGKKAAFVRDDKGRTPLNYLCENENFMNKTFGDLMAWWYGCLDINLFIQDFSLLNETSQKRKFGVE